MDSETKKMLLGAIVGVCGTLLVQAVTRMTAWFEDWRVSRCIRKGLLRSGLGGGVPGLTLAVRNESGIEIRCREVVLRCGGAGLHMSPVGVSGQVSGMLDFYDTLKKNFGMTPPVIQPYGAYIYAIAHGMVEAVRGPLEGFDVTVDFKNKHNVVKLVKAHFKMPKKLNSSDANTKCLIFDAFLRDLKSGALNSARLRFQLAPFPSRFDSDGRAPRIQ